MSLHTENKTRSAALLLTLLLTLSSCGGTAPSDETTAAGSESEAVTEKTDPLGKLSQLDYGGREFCFVGRKDYSGELCIEEADGDILNDAVFERNRTVEELLNVKFSWEIGQSEYSDLGKTSILAGEDTYDALMIHSRMAFNFMAEGLLHDWNDSMPYTELDKPWWSQDMLRNIAVGNKIYFMSGDISYYFLADTQMMLFNKQIFEDLDLNDPYQTVRDGKWTFDTMAALAKKGTIDLNGDGRIAADTDKIGYITTRWRGPNFVYIAEGTRLITLDSNKMPELTLNTEKAADIFTRYMDFLRSDTAQMIGEVEGADMMNAWMSGHVMFFDGLLKYAANMREMKDDFGILPMPKFDEAQEAYLSTPGAGINFYAVPVTVKDSACTSAVLEALAVIGHETILPAYYDVTLKSKYSRDEESAEMLDLIRENIIVDFGSLIYGHTVNKLNSIGYFLADEKQNLNFASFYAENVETFQTYLKEVIDMIS